MRFATSGRLAGVLGERNFRRYYVGQSLSLLGDALLPIAMAFAVLDVVGSASALGLVLAAGFVPQVILMLVGGVVADRVNRRTLMIGCDVLRLCSQAAQGTLLLTGHANLVTMVVLNAFWGVGAAFFKPSSTGLVAELVDAGKLQQANGLIGLSSNIAFTLGPAFGGVLIVAISPGAAILIDAATFAASALALGLVRLPAAAARTSRPSIVADLAGGWQEFRSRTWLWTLVVWAAGFHLLALPAYQVLGPLTAKDELGGVSAWATIGVGTGLGLVLGGVLALRLKPRFILRSSFVPLGLYGLPLLLLAFPHALPGRAVTIAFAALLGNVGVSMFNVFFGTAIQQHVPLEAISRVSAYDWLGSLALLPIGQAIIGPMAGLTSTRVMLVVGGLFMLGSIPALFLIRSARDLPYVHHQGQSATDSTPAPGDVKSQHGDSPAAPGHAADSALQAGNSAPA
jgi:MFS family permease